MLGCRAVEESRVRVVLSMEVPGRSKLSRRRSNSNSSSSSRLGWRGRGCGWKDEGAVVQRLERIVL